MSTTRSRASTPSRTPPADPDLEQPYAELGLADDEYARIREVLGRRPTRPSWRCTRSCGASTAPTSPRRCTCASSARSCPPSAKDVLLVGMGENAGVVDVGQGIAVTFKVESHNHPSFVEPYQGAATGVGGIIRDILTMGARPVAVMDPLRFGDADAPDTARVLPGIVAGIGGYGNCMGLPNIGGEVVFDPSYDGNPLVNALCLGVLPKSTASSSPRPAAWATTWCCSAPRPAATASAGSPCWPAPPSTPTGPARRPSVQVGDPFQEKIVTELCLELFEKRPGAGHPGPRRRRPDLRDHRDAAPRAAPACTSSSSTCRCARPRWSRTRSWPARARSGCCAVVTPEDLPAVLEAAARWGVLATAIGEVVEGDRLVITGTARPSSTCRRRAWPTRARSTPARWRRPADLDALQADRAEALPAPGPTCAPSCCGWSPAPTCARAAGSPSSTTTSCRATPCMAQPDDAGVVRLSEDDRPRGGAGHRRQRPLHPARPLRRRPAGAGRGVPQRRDRPGRSRWPRRTA